MSSKQQTGGRGGEQPSTSEEVKCLLKLYCQLIAIGILSVEECISWLTNSALQAPSRSYRFPTENVFLDKMATQGLDESNLACVLSYCLQAWVNIYVNCLAAEDYLNSKVKGRKILFLHIHYHHPLDCSVFYVLI